jgi:hypothetical protein
MEDFEELPKMAGWHEAPLVPTSTLTFADVKPNHTIVFHRTNDKGWVTGDKVGELDFNGDVMKFEGSADESAKIFFDFIAKYFDQRLKDERAKELEACCELLEGMHAASTGSHNYYLWAANELRKLRKGAV